MRRSGRLPLALPIPVHHVEGKVGTGGQESDLRVALWTLGDEDLLIHTAHGATAADPRPPGPARSAITVDVTGRPSITRTED